MMAQEKFKPVTSRLSKKSEPTWVDKQNFEKRISYRKNKIALELNQILENIKKSSSPIKNQEILSAPSRRDREEIIKNKD